MNSRKIISGDPLAELRASVQRLEELRAHMSEEERQQTAEQHEGLVVKMAEMEERERRYQARRARLRAVADAYNRATPEERARPFSEWLRDFDS